LGKGFSERLIFYEQEHLLSQIGIILRFEEFYHRIIKIISIYFGGRQDNRDPQRHEFQRFCAEGFAAERIVSLGDNPQVRIGHDFGYLLLGQRIKDESFILETQFFDELFQNMLGIPIPINVEFGPRDLIGDAAESAKGDVQSLVPVHRDSS
jgi:hypothetical protein